MTDQETGVEAAPAAGVETEAQPEVQPTEGAQENQEVQVPVHVVQALRDQLKTANEKSTTTEQELQNLKGQIQLYQNQLKQQQAPTQTQQATDPFEGKEADDLLTVGEVKALWQQQQQNPQIAQTVSQLQQQLNEVRLSQEDPNWQQTIQQHLPGMIATNPQIQHMIQSAPNPMLAALQMARMSPTYQQAQQPAQEQPKPDSMDQINQILQNAMKPGSPAQAGGQGALSQTDFYRDLTDEELDAKVAEITGG